MGKKGKTNNRYGLTTRQMAKRILEREDNIYKMDCITDILVMYMEECEKALANGEKITLTKVGTLTPQIKVHQTPYHIPWLNEEDGANPPYTNVQFIRSFHLRNIMNKKLLKNIENDYLGLGEACKCTTLQIGIMKDTGYYVEKSTDEE